MFVSGFTFIRNAVQFDFPIVEAIMSILPLCDEVVVAVGKSDDATMDLIRSIDDHRIRMIETVWDDNQREGGKVLAMETNKALDAIDPKADWCFYIQGDEVVHEDDYPLIKATMLTYLSDLSVEGLLFDYTHFYGSYDFVGTSRRWYRREVRIVRNDRKIRSWKDAQGFRWTDGRKLHVAHSGGRMFHYGWVKHPDWQQAKQMNFNALWHDQAWVEQNIGKTPTYQYDNQQPLIKFEGTHPMVMQERVRRVNWQFEIDPTKVKRSWKERITGWVERYIGWRIGEYRNYKWIK